MQMASKVLSQLNGLYLTFSMTSVYDPGESQITVLGGDGYCCELVESAVVGLLLVGPNGTMGEIRMKTWKRKYG